MIDQVRQIVEDIVGMDDFADELALVGRWPTTNRPGCVAKPLGGGLLVLGCTDLCTSQQTPLAPAMRNAHLKPLT